MGAEQHRAQPELDRFLRDMLDVLPETLRFFLIKNHRGIVRCPSHKNFDRYCVVPDLHFAMRDPIKIQGTISDPDKVHNDVLSG